MVLLLALAMLVQDDDPAAAVQACEQVFSKNKDSGTRVQAVQTLAAIQHEKVLAKLAMYLSNDDKAVKAAALQGLAGYAGLESADLKRSAAKAIQRSLDAGINLKDHDYRAAVAGALGPFQDELTVTTMKLLLEDKELKVALAAMNGCVAMRAKPLVEALISEHKSCEKIMKSNTGQNIKGRKPVSSKKDAPDAEDLKIERAATLVSLIPGALQNLLGVELKTGAEMEVWWSKNRLTFTFEKDKKE